VIDGCDGEVARLTFRGTPFGGWMDTLLDRYADVVLVVGITNGFSQGYPGNLPWVGCVLAAAGFVLPSYAKKEFFLRYQRPMIEGVADKLVKRDLRLFSVFIGALLHRPFEAILLIGFLSHLWLARRLFFAYLRQDR